MGLIIETGYYRKILTDGEDQYVSVGDIIYVRLVNKENVKFYFGDDEYYTSHESINEHYEFLPNGEADLAAAVLAAQADFMTLHDEQIGLDRAALEFKPHIDEGEFKTGGLMVTGNTPEGAKKAIATFRNDVTKFQKQIEVKKARIDKLVRQQAKIVASRISEFTALMHAKTKELTAFINKANEAIKVLNLYLGKDAEIVPIAKGQPAPKDTMITIRQMVLFMDEECAEEYMEGIDARQIDLFDKWLTDDPAHLRQVFPEPKGVVTLRPRRCSRDYGDCIWTNMKMAEANSKTYFLIRNGDNLYRFWLDFEIGTRMFPLADEFQSMFTGKNGEPLVPGSEEYMAVMDDVEKTGQHYYCVALILQGLLDRTAILKPLPAPYINILNRKSYDQFLQFVADDDRSKLFGNNLTPFKQWLKEVNSELCVGQRIMGNFSFTYGGRDGRDDINSRAHRLFPANADEPKREELFVLEKKGDDPDSYYFYYERDETVRKVSWSGRISYEKADVRARCKVYSKDWFILNFDHPSVQVETLDKYIKSRLNRHEYESMIPLLKKARSIKQQEDLEEAPFKQLLAGQIAKEYGVAIATAVEHVPELVRWWKLKNQTHRALTSDDAKAIKMIVAEFGIRQKRKVERIVIDGDPLVQDLIKEITAKHHEVLLIAHKAKDEYVALIPHNSENVFVTEQVWKINRSSSCPAGNRIRHADSKEWTTIDTRADRWRSLYESSRWSHWIRNATRAYYLTDPERQLVAEIAAEKYKDGLISVLKRNQGKEELLIMTMARGFVLDTKLDYDRPSITTYQCEWSRINGKVAFDMRSIGSTYHPSTGRTPSDWTAIREWPENAATYDAALKAYNEHNCHMNYLGEVARSAEYSIQEQFEARAKGKAFAEFLKEYGDPELWNEKEHNITIDRDTLKHYGAMLTLAIVWYEIDCNGKTLAEVQKLTKDLKHVKRKLRSSWWSHDDDDDDEYDDDGEVIKKPKKKVYIIKPEDADFVVTHDPMIEEDEVDSISE